MRTLHSNIHRRRYDRSLDYSLRCAGRFHGSTVTDLLPHNSISQPILVIGASCSNYYNTVGSPFNMFIGYSNDTFSSNIVSPPTPIRLALPYYCRIIDVRILFLLSIHPAVPRSIYIIKHGCFTERFRPGFYLCR